MVQEDRNSIEILHQIAAVQNATKNAVGAITENYTRNFINAIKNKDEKEDILELIQAMKQI